MIQVSQIAAKYAKALFQVCNDHEAVLKQLKVIEGIITSDAQILELFSSHLVTDLQKFDIIKKSFENKGLLNECFNLVLVLAEKGRISIIKDVLLAFESLVDLKNGVTRGTVKSSTALDSEEKINIENVVSKVTQKKVILSFSEDSKLVGGVVAQVGGWTIEDTVESHMTRLKEDLNRRAN